MTTEWLTLTLESDTTFGRGDGVAGWVDQEVQHDEFGLPYLSGRTLKSLLTAECAEVLWALQQSKAARVKVWEMAGAFLFGRAGSREEAAALRVGDARLPGDLRAAIANDFARIQTLSGEQREREWGFKRADILESVTALRRQTRLDETGAPRDDTLRTMRVILRKTPFEARVDWRSEPDDDAKMLFAACVRAFRRAGTGRNRGRGRLTTQWRDAQGAPLSDDWFEKFCQAVKS
mgnify:CR=1 FL=1